MLLRRIGRHLASIVALVLLGGFLSATFVRFAPGFDADERELDPSLSDDSLRTLRADRAAQHNVVRFYANYVWNAAHGDLGTSQALRQPVKNLLRERWFVTLYVAGIGLLLGWLLATVLAFLVSLWPRPAGELVGTALSGALICIPAAVLALASVILNAPGYFAIALIVFPKIYRYWRNLLAKVYAMPHITAARARGYKELRILTRHVLPVAGPQMISLGGITVSLALGAAIPVESLCGLPGLGQLAWQAALARDLPLLVNLTVIVTLVTLLANSSADVMIHVLRPPEAS